MSLIKCPDCGKDVSDKASACPSCGAPIAAAEHDAKHFRWSLLSMCMILAGAFLTMAASSAADPESPSGTIGLILTIAGVVTFVANQFRTHPHRR